MVDVVGSISTWAFIFYYHCCVAYYDDYSFVFNVVNGPPLQVSDRWSVIQNQRSCRRQRYRRWTKKTTIRLQSFSRLSFVKCLYNINNHTHTHALESIFFGFLFFPLLFRYYYPADSISNLGNGRRVSESQSDTERLPFFFFLVSSIKEPRVCVERSRENLTLPEADMIGSLYEIVSRFPSACRVCLVVSFIVHHLRNLALIYFGFVLCIHFLSLSLSPSLNVPAQSQLIHSRSK